MNKLFTLIILLLFCVSNVDAQGRKKLDSLLKEYRSPKFRDKDDTAAIRLISMIGSHYVGTNNDSAAWYGNLALELSKDNDYKRGEGMALDVLGNANYVDHKKALNYLFSSLKTFEEINDERSKAPVLWKIGGVYFNGAKYDQALEYFFKSLAIHKKYKDSRGIASVTHSIAGTYGNLGDHSKLLEYEKQALAEFEKNGQTQPVAVAYANMGFAYNSLKRYNEALFYGHKTIDMLRSVNGDRHVLGLSLDMLASTYLTIAKDSTTRIRPDSLLKTDRRYNLQKAIQYFAEAYSVNPDDPYIDLLKNWGEALRLSGRTEEALEKYMLYAQMRDSFMSRDNLLKVSAEETKREAYLKENQIKVNELLSVSKKKERSLFVVSMVLLAFVAVLIWRNSKKQRQANADLEAVNKRLAQEKVKLEDANERIAGEKERSDNLAVALQETIKQKDIAAGQLSLAADMKTKFLANISHELRTPVTLLTGMLELIKDAPKDGKGDKERLDVAYNNSRKLQFMVEEILDLSRLDAVRSRLELQSCDIAPVIKRMVYAFETFIEKEQIALQYSEEHMQGVHISADEDMLEKIINNLVYNAVKFNERGGWIKVHLFTTADRKHFVFTINNSGSIISQEDLPRIFERYYRGDSNAIKSSGVGIGLSLVKEFTLQMGGKVEVSSHEGTGTTFTLQFPVIEGQSVQLTPDEVSEPVEEAWQHFPEKQTVLIVEDNDEMRYYLREVLAGKVNLAEAINGKKALEWLAGNKADIIISDMMMPQMGGEELVTNLKAHEEWKKIPVITLTALADTDSRLNMLRLGIDDYIVKPFNASELRVRVYNLLNNLNERRQFELSPVEQDDISIDNKETDEFRQKITNFVLARMKTVDVSVYDLAYELAMSERQLYRLAKRLTGCTPAQLIKEVRLQKAYEILLSGTVYKVDDVAKQIGFEDANYFSRKFFERFGKRPSEFL